MTRRWTRAILTTAMLASTSGWATAHAGLIEPDSWATYEWQYYNPAPPDPPYQSTDFGSGHGGGPSREVWYNGDRRYDPTAPTWDIRSGATFSLAGWTPGDPILLSLTAVSAFGYFGFPGVDVTLFGTNGLLVESDFLSRHDPQGFMSFSFPSIDFGPPVTQAEDVSWFVGQIWGRYSHLGIVFSSGGGNTGNHVVFNVGLDLVSSVPEPSSAVMGALPLLAGLAALRHRGRRATRTQ